MEQVPIRMLNQHTGDVPSRPTAVAGVLARLHRVEIMQPSERLPGHIQNRTCAHWMLSTWQQPNSLWLRARALTAFVTYDKRLAAAAGGAGLPVAIPSL